MFVQREREGKGFTEKGTAIVLNVISLVSMGKFSI